MTNTAEKEIEKKKAKNFCVKWKQDYFDKLH